MSNDEKNNLQTDSKSVATPPRDRMMRAPVEHRKPTTAEILNGPRRRQKPILETSAEDNLSDA